MAPSSITELSIRQLVDNFYARVRADPLLSPVFEEKLAGKWNMHMPKMYAFWTKVLLGTGEFQGNVFSKHMVLTGIEQRHFVHWLRLFKMTAIDIFGVEDAAVPLLVAERIAASFQLGYFGKAKVV